MNKKPLLIKSQKALAFKEAIQWQVKPQPFLEGNLRMEAVIYYASRRNDLDEQLIMDGLEGLWYKNDRQIHHKKDIFKRLDRANPRVWVRVSEID